MPNRKPTNYHWGYMTGYFDAWNGVDSREVHIDKHHNYLRGYRDGHSDFTTSNLPTRKKKRHF